MSNGDSAGLTSGLSDLPKKLVARPRETAGAATARAFEFQKHHAMSLMLKAHLNGLAYTAYFDHHDDLIFIEHGETDAVSFYQVKSRTEGAWTPKKLSSRPTKGDPPKSIVGKAYYNVDRFGAGITRAAIVSNQMLKAKHADGSPTSMNDGEIILGELAEADWTVFSGALSADFTAPDDLASKSLLTFERIPLDLFSFQLTLRGEVTEFTDKLGLTQAPISLPFYDALLSEISRCTGDTMKAKSLADLKTRKAIDRAQIETLVARVQARQATPLEWWDQLSGDFDKAKMGATERQRLKVRCVAYWRACKSGNHAALALSTAASAAIVDNPAYQDGPIMTCVVGLTLTGTFPVLAGEPYDLTAALVVELMEHASVI